MVFLGLEFYRSPVTSGFIDLKINLSVGNAYFITEARHEKQIT